VKRVGAEGDLGRLFEAEAPTLWRSVYAYSGRPDIAEDAVAEAFAQAIEHRERIREPLAWIYRTAFRIATKEMKQERRSPPVRAATSYEDRGLRDLMEALHELSPKQRAAVYLHYEVGLSVRQVSGLIGASPATVKVHLFRGRNRLRELLGADEVDHD
jgi:RNA polymerase sigma-70 factor (ECF subfamily)